MHRTRLAAEADGYGPGTLALLRAAEQVDDERYRRGLADMARVADGFQRVLAVVDVLAGPAVAYPAPAEDPPFGAPEGEVEARFTGPYNLAGLPALSVPCGMVEDYLPVGLQLGSAARAEELLLSVSADVRGGRRMRMHDCTWMQIEEYLRGDDRIVLPLGSTEQHALPVAGRRRDPVRAGVAGGGRAAGRAGAAGAAVRPDAVLRGVSGQPLAAPGDLRRGACATCWTRSTARASGGSCCSTGTAATSRSPGSRTSGWRRTRAARCDSTAGGTGRARGPSCSGSIPEATHASWLENFPWTRLPGVEVPAQGKPVVDPRAPADPRPGRRARAARGRLVRRALPALGRGDARGLGRRRRRGPRPARGRLAVDQ